MSLLFQVSIHIDAFVHAFSLRKFCSGVFKVGARLLLLSQFAARRRLVCLDLHLVDSVVYVLNVLLSIDCVQKR